MAVVAIDITGIQRLDTAEATTNWTKITQAVAQEPDIVWQGTYSVSGKIGTSLAGHYLSGGTGMPLNMTTDTQDVVMMKQIWTNYAVLQSVESASARIGSGTGAYYAYYIADDGTQGDIDYPAKGGWLISPIDPNITAWRDGVVGSPSLTAVDYIATLGYFTATSKSENVCTDSVDVGDGMFLTGGDTAPAGAWQDFVDKDENQPSTGRFGYFTTIEGIIYVFGTHWIGRTSTPTTTLTEFFDELQTLVFPGGRVGAGWNAIKLDLGNASTDIDFFNVTHKGVGRSEHKKYFDTEYEVDGTNEELDITAHGFLTGDAVIYSKEGGTEAIGLTDTNEYFVEYMTADTIALHTTRQGAYTAGTPVGLTASTSTNAENHSLTRTPDTRPDLTATGTAGDFLADGCAFLGWRQIVLTSACELNGCTIVEAHFIDINTSTGATIDGCVIDSPTTAPGETFLKTNTVANIQNNEFIAGDNGGHAIELTSAAGSPYSLAGNTFTGWGPTHKTFNAQDIGSGGDVDDANDEVDITGHGFTSGDPVYYSDEGGTQLSGLVDQTMYYVRAVTANAISFHDTEYGALNNTNKIAITAGSDEDHAIYSANAALYNSSGGAVTINVSDGNVPTIRNSAGSSTTIVASVSVTFTNLINGTEVRVFDAGDNSDIAGTESVTGNQFQFSDEAANVVHVHFIKKDYVFIRLDNYTIPATAVSFPVVQQFDRNYSNP